MYTLIILITIGAIILPIINRHDDIHTIIWSILGGIIGGVLSLFIFLIVPTNDKIESSIFRLVSLQDKSVISGDFFIGTGHVNSEMVYSFYYKSAKNKMKLGQVNCWKSEIIYDTVYKPYMEMFYNVETDAFINNFTIKLSNNDRSYIFHIPENTIKNNYSLDAQ